MKMELEMRDDGGSEHVVGVDSVDQVAAACARWVARGDWGDQGCRVDVYWTLRDDDDEVVDEGLEAVDVEPDHDVLIRAAGGDEECAHGWQPHGGIDSNPGCWSLGGTTMLYIARCTHCGLTRRTTEYGVQRNPGQSDTVEYVAEVAE